MSKTSICIQMLELLNTGRVFKAQELADILETNVRNVIEYKKELELAGYYITSIPGKYGGYKLERSSIMPSIQLSSVEKQVLKNSYNYCLSKKEFVNKSTYTKCMGKIFSNLLIDDDINKIISKDKVNSKVEFNKIEEFYKIIEKAIRNKTSLEMTYNFLKGPQQTIKIDPYDLFIYDDEWRFFAWYHGKADIWYFKLSRIVELKETTEKFRVFKYYKPEEYLNKNVFSQNGEMFKLTLIAYGVRAKLFKEKQFGYNQIYEDLPDGSIKVTMDMQKNPSTYNTILGFGDLVKVLEPAWLIDKLKELLKEIYSKYEV